MNVSLLYKLVSCLVVGHLIILFGPQNTQNTFKISVLHMNTLYAKELCPHHHQVIIQLKWEYKAQTCLFKIPIAIWIQKKIKNDKLRTHIYCSVVYYRYFRSLSKSLILKWKIKLFLFNNTYLHRPMSTFLNTFIKHVFRHIFNMYVTERLNIHLYFVDNYFKDFELFVS